MSDTPPEEQTEATAAAQAEAKTAASAGEAPAAAERRAAEAATDAAKGAHPGISDADAERIGRAAAKAQIEELERRGVFEEPAVEAPPPAAPPEGVASGTESPGQAQEKTPGEEEPPKKRSWAQRFMGIDD